MGACYRVRDVGSTRASRCESSRTLPSLVWCACRRFRRSGTWRHNLTKGKGIQFLEGSYVLGRSVTGWRGAAGEPGFNGSLLEGMDQTVPGYSSGDQVFIFCTVVYDKPFLG